MFNWFKKKEKPLPLPPEPTQPLQPLEPKLEPKVEESKLSTEQKIELLSAKIEAMNERLKNIERMIEEIYRMAKS
ncbi:MAG: hypothetical protein QXL86_02475 [Candidatus Aenigmatarchaeota archaeon]